jgi:hypothetical protein
MCMTCPSYPGIPYSLSPGTLAYYANQHAETVMAEHARLDAEKAQRLAEKAQ